MKKLLWFAVALLLVAPAFAQTSTVQYSLRNSGTTAELGNYASQSACDTAAKARNTSAVYECPRVLKVVAACPAQPAADSQTVACPAGTTGSWTQTRTYVSAPSPTCWTAGAWTPSTAPAGACVTTTPTPTPAPTPGTALQLSPTGVDSGDCTAAPCLTFAYAFGQLAPGGELVLQDGTYTSAMSWTGPAGSAQIPSGVAGQPTYVHAANPGKVVVPGLFIGRSTRKDSYITVRGITFEGGAALYNTSFVTLKEVGVHGVLDVGTNDHDQGNTDNLIEDAWVWASGERIIAINYRAHRNVWRRVVVRGDGCGTSACAGSGNPNVGFTVYDSHDVSVQNVVVLDRLLLSTDSPYSDFAIASHTGGLYTFGRNEWLGTISLNAPDQAYYMEPDPTTTVDPTIKISNAVAWNAASGGYNLARSGTNNVIQNLTMNTIAGDALRVAPEMAGLATASNVLVSGAGRFAVNSAVVVSGVSATGTWSDGVYNQTTPTNVVAAPASALKYLTRIEAGSPLKGAGASGSDIGANVLTRYGVDGARFGDAGYNAVGTAALWPWPNEDRIKREMCAATARGFCSQGLRLDGTAPVSLTSYVWEAVGNPIPAGIYP